MNDVAEVQKEMKPRHVEFMASPALCSNPALLSLCLSIPQRPISSPFALLCFAVMKDDECILIILNQAVEIFYHHALSHHCPHSHPSSLLAREDRVAIAADNLHSPTSQEDRQQQ